MHREDAQAVYVRSRKLPSKLILASCLLSCACPAATNPSSRAPSNIIFFMRSETPSPSSTLLPGPYRPSRRRNASGSCGALMPNCTCTKGARTATPVLSTAQPNTKRARSQTSAPGRCGLFVSSAEEEAAEAGQHPPPRCATAHPVAHLLLHCCILRLLIRRQQRLDLFILSLAERHHLRPAIILRQRRIRAQCLHLRAAVLEDRLHLRRLIDRSGQVLFQHVGPMARIHHAAAYRPVAGPASVQPVEAAGRLILRESGTRRRNAQPAHKHGRANHHHPFACHTSLSLSAKCAGLGPGRRRSDYTIDGALSQRVPLSRNDFSGFQDPLSGST